MLFYGDSPCKANELFLITIVIHLHVPLHAFRYESSEKSDNLIGAKLY
jgi:hypothetical protein